MVEGTDGQPFSSYKYTTSGKRSANGSALLQNKEMLLVAKAQEGQKGRSLYKGRTLYVIYGRPM